MSDILERLAWGGGDLLLFDKHYHGRAEMRAIDRAVRAGYAVRVSRSGSPAAMELCITSTGLRNLAVLNRKQLDACRGRALLILRCRNAVRSTRLPFRRVLLRSMDQALRRVRAVLRAGHEFDPAA